MIRKVNIKGSKINIRDIVQIGMNRIDFAKTDCKNLTLMVVQEKTFKKKPSMHRLANKLFQISTLCRAGATTIIKDLNPKLVDLDGVLLNYQDLPNLINEQLQSKCHLLDDEMLSVVIAKADVRLEPVLVISQALNAHLNVIREIANIKITDYGGGVTHRNYRYVGLLQESILIIKRVTYFS